MSLLGFTQMQRVRLEFPVGHLRGAGVCDDPFQPLAPSGQRIPEARRNNGTLPPWHIRRCQVRSNKAYCQVEGHRQPGAEPPNGQYQEFNGWGSRSHERRPSRWPSPRGTRHQGPLHRPQERSLPFRHHALPPSSSSSSSWLPIPPLPSYSFLPPSSPSPPPSSSSPSSSPPPPPLPFSFPPPPPPPPFTSPPSPFSPASTPWPSLFASSSPSSPPFSPPVPSPSPSSVPGDVTFPPAHDATSPSDASSPKNAIFPSDIIFPPVGSVSTWSSTLVEKSELLRTLLAGPLAFCVSSFWLSQCLYVAAKLRIPDLMKDRDLSVREIAHLTGAHAPSIYRLMRALAGQGFIPGIFIEVFPRSRAARGIQGPGSVPGTAPTHSPASSSSPYSSSPSSPSSPSPSSSSSKTSSPMWAGPSQAVGPTPLEGRQEGPVLAWNGSSGIPSSTQHRPLSSQARQPEEPYGILFPNPLAHLLDPLLWSPLMSSSSPPLPPLTSSSSPLDQLSQTAEAAYGLLPPFVQQLPFLSEVPSLLEWERGSRGGSPGGQGTLSGQGGMHGQGGGVNGQGGAVDGFMRRADAALAADDNIVVSSSKGNKAFASGKGSGSAGGRRGTGVGDPPASTRGAASAWEFGESPGGDARGGPRAGFRGDARGDAKWMAGGGSGDFMGVGSAAASARIDGSGDASERDAFGRTRASSGGEGGMNCEMESRGQDGGERVIRKVDQKVSLRGGNGGDYGEGHSAEGNSGGNPASAYRGPAEELDTLQGGGSDEGDPNLDRRFALSPLGVLLRSDVEGGLHSFAIHSGEVLYTGWGSLLHSTLTGEAAFDSATGRSLWEHYEQNPDEAATFNRAMVELSALHSVSGGVVDKYDWSQGGTARVICDIGGGHGRLLSYVLPRHRGMSGVLFDLDRVLASGLAARMLEDNGLAVEASALEKAQSLGPSALGPPPPGSCRLVPGSFFEESSIPPGCDVYVLKHIIHDWADEEAVTILANVASVMPRGGRLVLLELVIRETGKGYDMTPSFGPYFDLNMLVAVGGAERTVRQYEQLLTRAGLQLKQVVSSGLYSLSALEAVKP